MDPTRRRGIEGAITPIFHARPLAPPESNPLRRFSTGNMKRSLRSTTTLTWTWRRRRTTGPRGTTPSRRTSVLGTPAPATPRARATWRATGAARAAPPWGPGSSPQKARMGGELHLCPRPAGQLSHRFPPSASCSRGHLQVGRDRGAAAGAAADVLEGDLQGGNRARPHQVQRQDARGNHGLGPVHRRQAQAPRRLHPAGRGPLRSQGVERGRQASKGGREPHLTTT